jgi:hypothetical protein
MESVGFEAGNVNKQAKSLSRTGTVEGGWGAGVCPPSQ